MSLGWLVLAIALLLTLPPSFAAERSPAPAEAQTARYFESIRKDPNLLVAFLLEMPKGGDLHNHLSGAIYAETLIDWAKEQRACVDPKTFYLTPSLKLSTGDPYCPAPTVLAETALANPVLYRGMVDAFSMRNWELSGQSGHDHFFDTFDKFGAATHGNTGPMLAETAARAASQREIYQELMFTPAGKPFGDMLNADAVKAIKPSDDATPETFAAMRKALSENGLASAIQDAIQQTDEAEKIRGAQLKCGAAAGDPGCQVVQRYLFQVLRGLPKQIVFAQMLLGFELAKADPRFVGLNMVMPEDYYVPMHDFPLHMRMMQYLHSQYPGVHLTLHAGELAAGLVPPEGLRFHVRESVEVAGAERIGHGVDVLNETNALELLNELAKKNVMVEICLTSNDVILGVRGANHPLHDYMKAGVPVALATDDEGVSRSDMTHEYLRGAEDQNLSYAELKRMARTSLEHAFIAGPSLWGDGKAFTPVQKCAGIQAGAKPAAACQTFLDGSEKARLQLKLEQQFREFEARKWP
ncbi:MAG TPA: adenosine deaminase [Candidatus Methylomirabilis sp.]|nr:adenosine deaminase [Candidatus Methylomirabilis sp.]